MSKYVTWQGTVLAVIAGWGMRGWFDENYSDTGAYIGIVMLIALIMIVGHGLYTLAVPKVD